MIRRLTVAAMFMALNIILSLSILSLPVPGGHLYLNDIIICTAALLLDPFSAFAVGGVGSFIGDMLFYPAPMFVSLATHGLQAVVISLCSRHLFKKHPPAGAIVGVLLGAVIMVTGYTLGRAYVYATPEYAIIKLPYEILQAALGVIAGPILCFGCDLRGKFSRILMQEN